MKSGLWTGELCVVTRCKFDKTTAHMIDDLGVIDLQRTLSSCTGEVFVVGRKKSCIPLQPDRRPQFSIGVFGTELNAGRTVIVPSRHAFPFKCVSTVNKQLGKRSGQGKQQSSCKRVHFMDQSLKVNMLTAISRLTLKYLVGASLMCIFESRVEVAVAAL